MKQVTIRMESNNSGMVLHQVRSDFRSDALTNSESLGNLKIPRSPRSRQDRAKRHIRRTGARGEAVREIGGTTEVLATRANPNTDAAGQRSRRFDPVETRQPLRRTDEPTATVTRAL